jgi:hypothetical protein
MRLIAYTVTEPAPVLRPAPHERDWMDATREKYAYRCLPLAAANAHGWEILCPFDFAATWSGGDAIGDIVIDGPSELEGRLHTHFGHGILTFDVGHVFRTEPDINLWVTGPANQPKDGIAPLSGLIEADWIPYTFTMNWIFTCPGEVHFVRDEPFCFFFPVGRGVVDDTEPEIRSLYDDPDFVRNYTLWRESRTEFLVDLKVPGSAAREEKWQRTYFRGLRPDGTQGAANHQTRIRAKPFRTAREKAR